MAFRRKVGNLTIDRLILLHLWRNQTQAEADLIARLRDILAFDVRDMQENVGT
jgi:hypothetical protein